MSLSLAGIVAALALLTSPCHHDTIASRYDPQVRLAVDHYWPVEARPYWCAYKAQLAAESALDPTAVSAAGARGIAQFMPQTWVEVRAQAGLMGASPHEAGASIRAGAYYMGWLRRRMTEPRSERCRLELQQAGYNAGLGHIWQAQRIARERGYAARCWDEIKLALPEVTGRHAAETISYISRIAAIEALLRGQRP